MTTLHLRTIIVFCSIFGKRVNFFSRLGSTFDRRTHKFTLNYSNFKLFTVDSNATRISDTEPCSYLVLNHCIYNNYTNKGLVVFPMIYIVECQERDNLSMPSYPQVYTTFPNNYTQNTSNVQILYRCQKITGILRVQFAGLNLNF